MGSKIGLTFQPLQTLIWLLTRTGKVPTLALRKKCPNMEFFLVQVFPYCTEYRDIRRKSQYSVQTWENMDQKNFCILTLFTQCGPSGITTTTTTTKNQNGKKMPYKIHQNLVQQKERLELEENKRKTK